MNRRPALTYMTLMMGGIAFSDLLLEGDRWMPVCFAVLFGIVLLRFRKSLPEMLSIGEAQLRRMVFFFLAGMLSLSSCYFTFPGTDEMVKRDGAEALTGTVIRTEEGEDRARCVIEAGLPSGRRRILILDYREEREAYEVGIVVRITGELKLPEERRNPGCFDYRRYLRGSGISYVLNVKGMEQISDRSEFRYRLQRRLGRYRMRYEALFQEEETAYGLIKGAVFGDRSSLDEEIYREFTGNGTAHILAVSGLHVGFLLAMLGRLGRSRKSFLFSLAMTAMLILYGMLTRWNVSTVRAVLIAVFSMAGFYVRRPVDLTSSAAVSAMLILLVRPYQIFCPGFILSYLAIFGMSAFARPISLFLGRTLADLVSIQLAVIPYMIYAFNRFNPLSFLINVPVVFLASVMIPVSVTGFIGSMVFGRLPAVLVRWVSLLTMTEVRLNHILYLDGTFDRSVSSPSAGMVLMVYVLLFFLSSEWMRVCLIRRDKNRILAALLVMLIPVSFYGYQIRNPFVNDDIVFIDVGQGDGIHLRAGMRNVLIDGGGSMFTNIGERILEPYFRKNRADSIDLSLLTHLHMDHYKGARELAAVFPVEHVMVPACYEGSGEYPEGAGSFRPGDSIRISEDVRIDILWPPSKLEGPVEDADENELNGVFMIHCKGYRVLITGDLLEKGEQDMIEYYRGTDRLKCDVLKVAHHGSRSSSSEAFLEAADPKLAVIQVGQDNLYGHPNQETLDALRRRGIPVYRNDLNGAVGLELHRSRIKVDKVIQ